MMLSPSGVKIWRPRQIYVGSSTREYVPLEERTGAVQVGIGMEPSVIEHSGYVCFWVLDFAQDTEFAGQDDEEAKIGRG